jgi:hypothetical protein
MSMSWFVSLPHNHDVWIGSISPGRGEDQVCDAFKKGTKKPPAIREGVTAKRYPVSPLQHLPFGAYHDCNFKNYSCHKRICLL